MEVSVVSFTTRSGDTPPVKFQFTEDERLGIRKLEGCEAVGWLRTVQRTGTGEAVSRRDVKRYAIDGREVRPGRCERRRRWRSWCAFILCGWVIQWEFEAEGMERV